MKGLIVKAPWIDMILDELKTWEIRGSNILNVRGEIALIKSGTGLVMGTVMLKDSFPVSVSDLKVNKSKHGIEDLTVISYKRPHAWVLEKPVRFKKPIPYVHPQGAVIWVNLDDLDLAG